MKCEYGCGGKAKFTLKCGKHCCSEYVSSCIAMRKKNSESKQGINPWEGRDHPRGMLGKRAWNKGETRDTDVRIKQAAKKLRTHIRKRGKSGFTSDSRHTDATKLQISKTMKAMGCGGYRKGSGRGKSGWYKGIYCDSSWELAFVLWCELKGREIKRARKRFEYRYQGKWRNYLPDFRYKNTLGQWKYVEIKGFISEQWLAKKKAFPHDLILIGRKSMSRIFLPLVVTEYGKNFIDKYEDR